MWYRMSSKNKVSLVILFDGDKVLLGEKETGSTSALPIFIDFMKEALGEVKDRPFKIPKGIKLVKIAKWKCF